MKKSIKVRGVTKTPHKIPTFVRWLGAFRGRREYTASEIWEFENSQIREVAVESIFSKKISPAKGIFFSKIQSAKIGLLVDTEKSIHRKTFVHDAWTEVENNRLISTRDICYYVTDISKVWGLAHTFYKSRWDKKTFLTWRNSGIHLESVFLNIHYKGIVVKGRILDRGLKFLRELKEVSGLPIFYLNKNGELEEFDFKKMGVVKM